MAQNPNSVPQNAGSDDLEKEKIMSNSAITLTSGISQNLYSLQSIEKAMEETSYRLSTGKRVNSALDDPISYFAAQNHTQRASDLEVRKDEMGEGIQLLKAADAGIESILDLIDSAKSLAQSALSAEDSSEVTEYMTQYNSTLDEITDLASDSGYKGVNLLGGLTETLEVFFDEEGSSSITLTGVDASATGLSLSDAASWWSTTNSAPDETVINASIAELDAAKDTLRANSKTLSNQLSIITAREDFTENMINTLTDGASNLVNADTNEESANLLTLQTQQQLATNALSISSDSYQAVLNLF
jgi:flagellin